MAAPGNVRETHVKLLDFFRQHPGKIEAAARFVGCSSLFARRCWHGPIRRYKPILPIIKDLLRDEAAAQTESKFESDALARAEVEAEFARKRRLQEEANRAEENVLRLARSNVLQGMGSLARMAKGVDGMATRVGALMERGVDAKGNAVEVPPLEALRIIQRFSSSLAQFTTVAESLIAIERLRAGLPTDTLGVTVEHNVTIGDAEQMLADASNAIQRAKKNGLIALPGGKAGGDAQG